MIKYIEGDLIKLANKGQFDVIAHGCNCFHTMGAGIAKTIKKNYPKAFEADLKTSVGDPEKLGTLSWVYYDEYKLYVVNAYTQFHWGISNGPPVSYEAIKEAMKAIKKEFSGKRIGLPKIGAGLAGGNWSKIKQIIEEELKDEDVTIVIYQS